MAIMRVYLGFKSVSLFPLNIWEHLPGITSSSCSSWEELSQRRLMWREVTYHQTWAQCHPGLFLWLNLLPFCYNIQHTLPGPLRRGYSSVLWKWEFHSSALSGGRRDPKRWIDLVSLFLEVHFPVLSFFLQFTVTFYLFVQKNKLVICTLRVAFCHLLCLAPRRKCCVPHMQFSTTTNF